MAAKVANLQAEFISLILTSFIIFCILYYKQDDVHISFEDQQKINRFAKHNARMDDLKLELEQRHGELKNLEEACEEIELFDEDEMIPFLFGEVFLSHNLSKTQEFLAVAKEKIQLEVKNIEKQTNAIKSEMAELKAHLYQRFGSNISLESDD